MNHRTTHHAPNRTLDSIEFGELARRFKEVFVDVLKAHKGVFGVLLLLTAIPSLLLEAVKWLMLAASSGDTLLLALSRTISGNIEMLIAPLMTMFMLTSWLFIGIPIRRKLLPGAPNSSGSLVKALTWAAIRAPFVVIMVSLYVFGGFQCCVIPGVIAYYVFWSMRYTALVQGLGFFQGLVRSVELSQEYFLPLICFHAMVFLGGVVSVGGVAILALVGASLDLSLSFTPEMIGETLSPATIGGLVAMDLFGFAIMLVFSAFVWFVELALMITIEEHRSQRNAG